MEEIVKIVASHYGIFYKIIYEKSRETKIREPRQVAMYLIAMRFPNLKPQEIGDHFNLDRATVLHSVKVVQNQMYCSKKFVAQIEKMQNLVADFQFINCPDEIPNFKPILFSTAMVQAIISGKKNQTRRIVKGVALRELEEYLYNQDANDPQNVKSQYGNVGDILWVRETFYSPILEALKGKFFYKADLEPQVWDFKWKPSLFMPKEACRLFLKVTSVRIEKLQDISRGDAMSEGCPFPNMAGGENPKHWFSKLWSSINGLESWKANPWVWVVEFERVERPTGFL